MLRSKHATDTTKATADGAVLTREVDGPRRVILDPAALRLAFAWFYWAFRCPPLFLCAC